MKAAEPEGFFLSSPGTTQRIACPRSVRVDTRRAHSAEAGGWPAGRQAGHPLSGGTDCVSGWDTAEQRARQAKGGARPRKSTRRMAAGCVVAQTTKASRGPAPAVRALGAARPLVALEASGGAASHTIARGGAQ